MLADCEEARKSIDIEQFIFEPDELGKRFFEVLKKKSKEGVRVRIICDAVGSYSFLNSQAERELKAEGVEIKFFNPIKPWRIGNFSSWFLRDHRKLLIVDGEVGHTGGVGLEKRMENWRDTNVRMTGPVVSEMSSVFERMWLVSPERKFFRFKPTFSPGSEFSFLTNSPRFRGRYIYHDLLRNIRSAKHYLYITTPYFVPSIRVFSALTKAAKRGVDVRLLLPEASDVKTVDFAAGSYFILALNAGVKIYLYPHTQKVGDANRRTNNVASRDNGTNQYHKNRGVGVYDNNRILHTKTAVSDDVWGTVGSANMDNQSLLLNFEGNIRSSNSTFISELKAQFREDISEIAPLTKEAWMGRSIFRKFLEIITWPIHGIL